MINPVETIASSYASTADQQRGSDQSATPDTSSAPRPTPKAQPQGDPLRLVVEPTSDAQGYTYKLYDRATGRLLIELPRDEASRMSNDPGYSAGQVFNAKA